jgi:small-conductance mechanosensitive channel
LWRKLEKAIFQYQNRLRIDIKDVIMKKFTRLIISILVLAGISASVEILTAIFGDSIAENNFISTLQDALIIACAAWIMIEVVNILKYELLKKFDITKADNLKSRKLHTQINLIEKVIVFIIVLIAVGLILLSIDSIKEVGIGIFASAGVAGIILGFSAQKVFGALFASIQIAIAQPFRLNDAVLVENEWGWIEEINLTYIVVQIWDKRRLILPTTYFLEKPFQNWTRTTADITGTVFLYTDYKISFDALRQELTRLLEGTPLWDKKVNALQVTNCKETTVEIRILVSAKDSSTAWDLRVYIREKMIEFIQKNFPESLPKTRLVLESK